MRTLTILLSSILVSFVALALSLAGILWLQPEWINQAAVVWICIGVATILGGSILFRIQASLVWRIFSFIAFLMALPVPLMKFVPYVICVFGCSP